MDEYGSITGQADDVERIAADLKRYGQSSFAYTPNGVDSYIMTLTRIRNETIIGIMPWGGRITGTVCVALKARGSFHFELHGDLHGDYVGEKLNINKAEGGHIAMLLNAIALSPPESPR